MNDEKERSSMNKENTIDILVSPKKKEEPKKESSASAPTPASKPAHPPKPAPARAAQGKEPSGTGERTRAIPAASVTQKTSSAQKAQETRVGSAVGIKVPSPTSEKKAAPAPRRSADKTQTATEKGAAWKDSFRATVVRTLVYMAVVVGISAILSVVGIRWANDIFALVKDEIVATVTIPENATISEVADIFADHGIIEYPSIFRMYIGYKNRDAEKALTFKAGEYELRSTLNYDQLVSLIKDRKTRQVITITIPEGYTVDEIIDHFISKGMGTREGFVDAIQNYPYDYLFMEKLNAITLSPNRKYRLEGYLFPDTYEFYTDSKEIAIVDKMLAAFQARFEEDYYPRLDELGMNLDQLITLASIVQAEGKISAEFYPISGVFHNRMKSRDLKKLESDATVQYCLPERKENLTYADLEIDSPYNTYIYEGLTPSAVCNPGWDAIMAALYPESHSYYFFVADTDGSTLFAKSQPEHKRNVAAVAQAKQQGTSVD